MSNLCSLRRIFWVAHPGLKMERNQPKWELQSLAVLVKHCLCCRISPNQRHKGVHSFIHSEYFYSASLSLLPLRVAPDYRIDAMSEVLQATVSEGLAQGPYMVAGVGFEPATLWT